MTGSTRTIPFASSPDVWWEARHVTTEKRIRQVAEEFVAQSQAKAARLRADLFEAQRRVAQLVAELEAMKLTPQRLMSFQIRRDGDYQCPQCGIARGMQSAMTPRPGQPKLDLFECDTCGFGMDVQH
jgi:hypothetical protein